MKINIVDKKNTAKLNKSSAMCLPAMCKSSLFFRSTSIGHLPSNVVFHQRSSSMKCHLPSKVIFDQKSSSIKAVFHQRLSSTKGCLPSKGIFHQSLSFILSCCRSDSSNYKFGRLDKKFFDKQNKTNETKRNETYTQSHMLVLLRITKSLVKKI